MNSPAHPFQPDVCSGAPPTKQQTLKHMPIEQNIYGGYNTRTGQLQFANKGLEYGLHNFEADQRVWKGRRMTLAMGLTECCVRFGHGKVCLFFAIVLCGCHY